MIMTAPGRATTDVQDTNDDEIQAPIGQEVQNPGTETSGNTTTVILATAIGGQNTRNHPRTNTDRGPMTEESIAETEESTPIRLSHEDMALIATARPDTKKDLDPAGRITNTDAARPSPQQALHPTH
jgi:hypothetical protein